MEENMPINANNIQNLIYTFRGLQVMIDSDLARLYNVETKNLNKAVSRNLQRFPESFRFRLSENEFDSLRFQIGTSNERGGRRYIPYVFTEQGVAMLSAILRSETAIQVSVQIMQAFVEMRHSIQDNLLLQHQIKNIENQHWDFKLETNQKFEKVFKALESKDAIPLQGIFFDGQVFDAHSFVSDLIRTAQKQILLIDNYVDDTVLTLISKKKEHVECIIHTKNTGKQLRLDVAKFNQQYGGLSLHQFAKSHDRFLILDNETVYHFGPSLKDLGKKWFAFSKMDKASIAVLQSVSDITNADMR